MTLAAPAVTIETEQCNHHLNRYEDWWFDIAHPSGKYIEVTEVTHELLVEDAYMLSHISGQGDVWVDAGCHVGLFSIAALQAGADVAAMYDMDPTMAWCAEANVRSYLMQQLVREYRPRIRPVAFNKQIDRPDVLIDAAMQTKETWAHGYERVCLKLDVQGAEQTILALDGPRRLAEAYDSLVLEWHFPDDLPWLTEALERGGWAISAVKTHQDVLVNGMTHIVWATSG